MVGSGLSFAVVPGTLCRGDPVLCAHFTRINRASDVYKGVSELVQLVLEVSNADIKTRDMKDDDAEHGHAVNAL